MQQESPQEFPKFNTPDQEVDFLRERLEQKEQELRSREQEVHRHEVARQEVQQYAEVPSREVMQENYIIPENRLEKMVHDFTPDNHEDSMMELVQMAQEKGIKNTLSFVSKMDNPHIKDDFHSLLAQCVAHGFPIEGLKEKSPLRRSLNMSLYEVSLPEFYDDQHRQQSLGELLSSMEQFYAGMLAVAGKDDHTPQLFTLEIAVSSHSQEIIFYAAVPRTKRDLFEKQILSIFPRAHIFEQFIDYNPFVEDGSSVSAYARVDEHPALPIKTYDEFEYDPLNVLLNAFSNLQKEGEGAALQLVFSATKNDNAKHFKKILKNLQEGASPQEALSKKKMEGKKVAEEAAKIFGSKKEEKEDTFAQKNVDQHAVENVHKKISSPIVNTNIRLVASAKSEARAKDILSHLESSFNQFENTTGNRFKFVAPKKRKAQKLMKDFVFRRYNYKHAQPLNLRELTTIMHFPPAGIESSPQFKQAKAGTAAAPVSLPQEGTLIGINKHRNLETPLFLTKEDRLRHFYTIGQTGTGKTTLLKNMIIQDIYQGDGVCMIDPHGNDIDDVLSMVPPERFDDVIYFDPGYTERVMGLNMLEYNTAYPEQKTFVVNELFGIFQKLYESIPESMGPMFEQYFRNATLLVLEDPDSGNTLFDISRVLTDEGYRRMKLSRSNNPILHQFWQEVATKAGGEQALQNIVPYITSKFDVFLANDIMRPVIAQRHSSFNFRQIMDERKILLVNLSKGKLGDINSSLIGLVLVGKILMSAFSRVDAPGKDMPPFYLYIDEFQNITTNTISVILSEARKYNLSLNVAHQYIAQLEQGIRDSVFGNVGTVTAFRTGQEDAEFLQHQFAPVFSASDIMNIDNYNAYVRPLVRGIPSKPFSIEIPAPPEGSFENAQKLKEMSYMKYGRPREEVESEVAERYKKK